jgi:hypothetical protein
MMPSFTRCFASWSQAWAPVPSCTIRLYFREAAMICCASNMLYEQGFSTKTSLPAWTAQIVCSVWWKLGVARDTASMLWSSSSLRMSANVAGRFLPAASTILQPLSTTA